MINMCENIVKKRNSIEPIIKSHKKMKIKKIKKMKKMKRKGKKKIDMNKEAGKQKNIYVKSEHSIKRLINIEKKKNLFKEKVEEIKEMKRKQKEKKDKTKKDRVIFGLKMMGSVLGAVISVLIF